MRLIILIMCFVSMNIYGQTQNSQEHLKFRGIPITGKYDSFIRKIMLNAGFEQPKNKNYAHPNHLCGRFGNRGGFYIDVKKDKNGNVYGFILEKFAVCYSHGYECYADIVKEIEKTYPKNFKSKFSNYYSDSSTENDNYLYFNSGCPFSIFDIRDKNGKQLGEISVKQLYSFKYNSYEVVVEFTDHRNGLIYDPYYKLSQKKINMTQYSSLKKLSMRDTGKELFFQGVLGNGKLFNFCAFNNDRNYIVSLLNSDLNKDEVKYIMNIYINRCYEDAKKTEPKLESLFANAHIMEGIREEVAQAKKQQARNSNSFSFIDLLHLFAPGVFTQNDVNLYNNMPQSSQSIIGSVIGSFFSGHYYTNEEMMYPDYETRFR